MSSDPSAQPPVTIAVAEDQAGARLDIFLARNFPEHSRVVLRKAISAGSVTVDGKKVKPAYHVLADQKISVVVPDLPHDGPEPEDIPLEILYEDQHMAAINKPPGMVVHPSKGHWGGTLAAALAFHFEQLSTVGGETRPGIVHRLDRDTSGVIVVAKTDQAHRALAQQFEERTTEKEYFALVRHEPDHDRDVITAPIGPHPHQREKMAIRRDHPSARDAETFYEVVERFGGNAHIRALPKTGRTHQIRVHLANIQCPVLCDRLYGGQAILKLSELTGNAADDQVLLNRQALHARRLVIKHPMSGETLELDAPLPEDLERTLTALRDRSK